MKLEGANRAPQVGGVEKLAAQSHYFVGKDPSAWQTHVPNYRKVRYAGVYPGIDLVYYGNHNQLEYDFIVSPGADPRRIGMQFRGADQAVVDRRGDLVLRAGEDEVRQRKPVIYQEVDGHRKQILGGYLVKNGASRPLPDWTRTTGHPGHQPESPARVAFQVGPYDRSKPLIIDPVLAYSSFLGGNGDDSARDVAVDAAGCVYVTGKTASTAFPLTAGAIQASNHGGQLNKVDLFVTKINPNGSGLVYSTFLGGTGDDEGRGVAVDAAGNAYLTGVTESSDFPVTKTAFKEANENAFYDAFVTKISMDGSELLYSTYMGGSSGDEGNDIAVDSDGYAYVAGITWSYGFPTKGGFRDLDTTNGPDDAFLAKFDTGAAGDASLLYSTCLGTHDQDYATALAVDDTGSVYLGGITRGWDFPVKNGVPLRNGSDPFSFVSRINTRVTGVDSLVYSTYLQGTGINAVATDGRGNVFVTGYADAGSFQPTPGAFDVHYHPPDNKSTFSWEDAFVTKINTTFSGAASFIYSTYLGGKDLDDGRGIAVDAVGNAYVTGQTSSPDFPTRNPLQNTRAGGLDGFLCVLNPSGSALIYSTYLGGSNDDAAFGIAVDGARNAYVVGETRSGSFRTTPGAFQPTFVGSTARYGPGYDGFVVKIAPGSAVAPNGLIATALSSTAVRFCWYDNSRSENHYEIQRRTERAPYATIATLPANSTTFAGSVLLRGETCTFRVRAAFLGGTDLLSNEASAPRARGSRRSARGHPRHRREAHMDRHQRQRDRLRS
jgi:hypothetical protein